MVYGTVLCSMILYSWCLMSAGLEYERQSVFCGLSTNLSFIGYDLAEMHFYFTFIDTIICTVVPSLLITVVNSLAVYRYRQCMRIYSSGVLRVRFLKDRDTPDPHLEEDTTNAKKFLLSQQSQTNQLSAKSTRSSASGKLRSSDLQLSRSLLIVTR
ncbi:unnamed protein product [Gongylonema pulchrum]|uniref:G_PROTEIN_RECEP_F1_2 domain-containing protein n=1 Tax=Gongylonema pulchrum TaxID=637853 RepID=A0A183DQG1_9BILA|nr:unnamed protein product [Gongylonema pulchrum]